MSSANTKEEVSCESCGKIYPKTSLLKHIAHSKPCKVHYGDERIKELKKANRKATQCTYFKKYYSKNADSEKERMRKNYDENFNYHSAIKKENGTRAMLDLHEWVNPRARIAYFVS